MVGAVRFELTAPCAQGRCATRLRYAPTAFILHHLRSLLLRAPLEHDSQRKPRHLSLGSMPPPQAPNSAAPPLPALFPIGQYWLTTVFKNNSFLPHHLTPPLEDSPPSSCYILNRRVIIRMSQSQHTVSPPQLAANRSNAARSTGPK